MVPKKRFDPYYKDIVNPSSLGDRDFQWFMAYQWYFYNNMSNGNKIWTYGLEKAGYVPEAFDFQEMV
jgi:hypothetical protein